MSKKWFYSLAAGATAVGAMFYGYASRIAPNRIEINRLTVPLRRMPTDAAPFTIAHLSDFHMSEISDAAHIERAVAQTNALKPDVVVLTGDFVTDSAEFMSQLTPILSKLRAKHGVYAVPGNHDHWSDINAIDRGLAAIGIPLLRNANVLLDEHIALIGLDDPWVGTGDPDVGLWGVPDGVVRVLLVHEPDFALDYAEGGRFDVQLSGHTHGGQARLPFIRPPYLPRYGQKFIGGLFQVKAMWLYVNRGIGVSGARLRFFSRPEITLITLVAEH